MKFTNKSFLFAALLLLGLSGCTDHTRPNVELINDMAEQPALKSQDVHPGDREKSSMFVPPTGSVPRGYAPYQYAFDPEAAGAKLKNPFAGNRTPEVLEMGKVYYTRYCQVCHGEKADGKGPVHEKFQGLIKSLQTAKVREWSDGRIFHVITAGQGVMGQYETQINKPEWRWAIVNYVRELQRNNPVEQIQ